MDQIAPEIRRELTRWKSDAGTDQYEGQNTIGIMRVLDAHALLADFFFKDGEPIGGVGPKSLHLLHSALSRQFVSFGGETKYEDWHDIVGTLFFGLVKNHPFHDCNKRTALLIALFHLLKLGRVPTSSGAELEELSIRCAESSLGQYPEMEHFSGQDDAEVRFLGWYFRSNSRQSNSTKYVVTFNELNRLLGRFGFELSSPAKNYVYVVRQADQQKLLKIGLPSWKAEVNVKALHSVLKVAELTAEHGKDSDVFFKGHEPLASLIDIYYEPLKRLADA